MKSCLERLERLPKICSCGYLPILARSREGELDLFHFKFETNLLIAHVQGYFFQHAVLLLFVNGSY